MREPTVRTVMVHGHQRAYVHLPHRDPAAPTLLLLHGIGDDLTSWDRVLRDLARDFSIIAPDLLGHGRSAKPRADYSIGGYANGMRDLLSVLDVDRVTVVGHSFGGGVAMQMGYQYPERTERIVLVAPGGLGREVTPLLRALTLPGAGAVLASAELPPVRWAVHALLPVLRRLPIAAAHDADEMVKFYDALADKAGRSALMHVARGVMDWRGQVITMLDRCYLTVRMPVMVVWGDRDPVIPVSHAEAAARAMPGARVERMEGSGHFPHRDAPEEFCAALRSFVASTEPSTFDRDEFRALLRGKRLRPRQEQRVTPLARAAARA
ncbi:MAG TPA: alpha/beta fold hydrolase [Mycobacteriales bacterium]|nr:alpha/beta fold hydrolase [Mycobacteriales bacterium]